MTRKLSHGRFGGRPDPRRCPRSCSGAWDGDPTITDEQFQAAVAAAPYVHPRLAATEATVKSDNILRIISDEPLTAEEWLEKFAPPAGNAVN